MEPGLSSPREGGGHLVCFGQTVKQIKIKIKAEDLTLNLNLDLDLLYYSSRRMTRMRWQCGQVITSSARNSVL